MGEVYTYNGTHLTIVRDGTVEFTQSAETGQVGSGRLALDDTAGTQAIVGQKDFSATQSSCSTPLLFRGYIDGRSYGRDSGNPRKPHVGAARGIGVELVDTNAMLGFNAFRTSAANRPAESVATRTAWLQSTEQMTGIADNGRVTSVTAKGMDAADYRNQYPGDVLVDLALAAGGFNYHVNDYGSGPELTFRDDNASTADTSSLRISNVLSDASSVTLHPFKDATLSRRPGRVYSLLALAYAKGTEYAERAATALTFNGRRVGIVSNSNIKTAAKAQDELASLLWQHSTEEDFIECTVLATDAQVNLMPAGWRIQAKFSHLSPEGYASFTYFRIIEVSKKPIVADGALYEVRLKLSPQEAGPPSGAIVQTLQAFYGTGGSGFPPYTHLTNPPSIGNTLLVAISRRVNGSIAPIAAPNTNAALPRWGAGAWTDVANSLGGFAQTYVEATAGDGTGHTVAFFYKVVDSTEQDCVIGNDYENVAVWELNPAMTPSTYARANNQTAGNTFDCGTLGTVASGALAFMIVHSVPDETTLATVTPASGWVTDWYRGNYPIWYAAATFPVAYIAHALGAGAAIDPSVVNAGAARRWCGLAIVMAP